MLSDDNVEQYNKSGYTTKEGMLTKEEVDGLIEDLRVICDGSTLANHMSDRLEMEPNQEPDGKLVRRIYQPCTYYQSFRELSESDKLLDSIEKLIGPDILFHYSKINMKPPAIGSVVEWHQDLLYYPLTNRDSLAILIYLDDADKENGCLQVIPGRHLLPPMSHSLNGYFQGRITEPVDESQAVFLEGRAGTAIFMHCMTPHSSTLNSSDKSRRTLILSYRSSDSFLIFPREGDTAAVDAHTRHVRGRALSTARFTEQEFPIPRLRRKVSSLYELQELSRREESEAS